MKTSQKKTAAEPKKVSKAVFSGEESAIILWQVKNFICQTKIYHFSSFVTNLTAKACNLSSTALR